MKIIILGAGQVGSTVAQNLVLEHNDVTVVDSNPQVLQVLQDKYDLRTVAGVASHPTILRRAGAEDADMIVAVTNSDETNMIACQVAYTLFQTPTRIARLRSPDYLHETTLFREGAIPIDVLISPEKLVTDYIERLLQYPGTLQVLDFAGGLVQLVCVRAYSGSPMVGQQLRTLHERMPRIDSRVAAIYRQDHAIIPTGDTIIEADDEVFFVAARKDIRAVMREMRRQDKPVRRVMLAGGGNIGRGLAQALEADYNTKLIESNPLRAQALSRDLKRTIVLQGDAADRELLLEENVEDVDVFCAVTNNDEANILSAMLARRLGARKVMALINRTAYVDLIESGSIDIAISPQQITIGTLLAYVRRGDVVAVHSLRRGAAEAIEAIAHGDARTSRVVGRRIDELALPPGITIGALVRGSTVLIAHDDIIIQSDDHVVLFLLDKKQIGEVERLFQVSITFI